MWALTIEFQAEERHNSIVNLDGNKIMWLWYCHVHRTQNWIDRKSQTAMSINLQKMHMCSLYHNLVRAMSEGLYSEQKMLEISRKKTWYVSFFFKFHNPSLHLNVRRTLVPKFAAEIKLLCVSFPMCQNAG